MSYSKVLQWLLIIWSIMLFPRLPSFIHSWCSCLTLAISFTSFPWPLALHLLFLLFPSLILFLLTTILRMGLPEATFFSLPTAPLILTLGWWIHVNPWLIHVNVWQKPLQYCKVISLQLIKINGKKKKRKRKKKLKTNAHSRRAHLSS